jgi:hypothetical protein
MPEPAVSPLPKLSESRPDFSNSTLPALTAKQLQDRYGSRAYRTPRNSALVDLLFATGVRVGEASALDLGDCFMSEAVFKIHGKGGRDRLALIQLAAPQGFEPRYADPESAVLPLNEGAVFSVSCGTRTAFYTIGTPHDGQTLAHPPNLSSGGARPVDPCLAPAPELHKSTSRIALPRGRKVLVTATAAASAPGLADFPTRSDPGGFRRSNTGSADA